MTKLTRSGLVYSVMNANPTLPMDEVLEKIVAADKVSGLSGKACDLKRAKAYYVYAVKNGLAAGVGATTATRAPKVKAPKAAAKPKLIRVPKPKVQGDKPKITDKTVEEIADIRAKNLARLKAVGRKYAKGQYAEGRTGREHTDEEARAEVANLEHELDSFKAPAFLKMADVKALV